MRKWQRKHAEALTKKWAREFEIDDWSIEVVLEESTANADPINNNACHSLLGPKSAKLVLDPRTPANQRNYIVAHELGHVILEYLDDFLFNTLSARVYGSKQWTKSYNAASNLVIDHWLRAGWGVKQALEDKEA